MSDDELAAPRLAELFQLNERHVLVSGAASGLGRAISAGVLAFGGRVTLVDRDALALQATATELGEGDVVATIVADVTNSADVDAAIATAELAGGTITGLVNSAGLGRRAFAVDLTEDAWQEVIDVNLNGTFRMCRAVGRRLIAAGVPGAIVNISSIAGQVGLRTGNANYAASKGGVDAAHTNTRDRVGRPRHPGQRHRPDAFPHATRAASDRRGPLAARLLPRQHPARPTRRTR